VSADGRLVTLVEGKSDSSFPVADDPDHALVPAVIQHVPPPRPGDPKRADPVDLTPLEVIPLRSAPRPRFDATTRDVAASDESK
jgi:hypothetical protein